MLAAAALGAILHFVPYALPLLTPGERTAAVQARLFGQIGFLVHPRFYDKKRAGEGSRQPEITTPYNNRRLA
jgi:hypothetical protein